MAKKIPYSIQTATARAKLVPRNHAYWHTISPGRYLGYRLGAAGAVGSWTARLQAGRGEETQPLGKLEEVADEHRFKIAQRMAMKFFDDLESKGLGTQVIASKITLRQVLREYVADRKVHKGEATGKAAESRLDMIVVAYTDTDGAEWIDRPLAQIKRAEFAAWRLWLAKLPVELGKSKGQMRTGASVNRDIATFRAALNLAHRTHGIDNAWKGALKRDLKADIAREGDEGGVFLEIEQRQRFLQAAQEAVPALVPLATMMCIAPVRPGALAAARVVDYDPKTRSLFIRKDKVHAGRKVPMPPEAVKLLAQAVKGKTPLAHLFPSTTGKEWTSVAWGKWMRKIVGETKGLPSDMTLYWLRHSRITDLVEAGISPMQIAATAGTSVAIIEKHYFQQRDEVVRKALAVVGF